ncbi:MFS general substrate transporter [Meredithblackwellia eburnea MCA 4105]
MTDTPPSLKESKEHYEEAGLHDARDAAALLIAAHRNEAPPTPEEERRVLFKIDCMLMPMMMFIYGLQYLDKLGYSLGTSFGSIKDLHLSVIKNGKTDITRYKTGATLFWAGFLVGVYPCTFMAQKLPVAKATTIILFIWGFVYLCGAFCNSYQGIFAQRFFLGVFESGVTPCFMILTASFYKKPEQASRTGLWYAACGLGSVIGMPCLYGVLKIHSSDMNHLWKRFYYLWGAVTIVFSGLFYLFVPSSPTNARFLSERERFVAVQRLRENQSEVDAHKWEWSQAKEAITDPRVLILFPIAFLSYFANACVSTFSPLILSGFGYSPLQTLLMLMPAGAANWAMMVAFGYFQQHVRNVRLLCFHLTGVVVLVCSAILWKTKTTQKSARYASVIMLSCYSCAYVALLGLLIANVAGRTKRTVANAIYMTAYCTTNICSPLTFPSTQSPTFPDGFKTTLATMAASMGLAVVYQIMVMRENKRRDALGDEGKGDHAFEDITDRQNLAFRYLY